MIGSLFTLLRRAMLYDADRDFYVRHFPVIAEQIEPRLRPMSRLDLRSVAEIEQSAYEFPWSESTFGDCLTIGYSCWVYERAGTVLAYGILSYGAGEAHVMNLCVSPAHQGRGYGRLLMRKLMQEARMRAATVIFLEVRPSNQRALSLYRSLGFNEIGVRKGYYPAASGREDALVLACDLSLEPSAAA